ncbi:flagellar protein FlaG [Cellvibrio sp. pealriver]|uniref:flagellar protein FlaG n=1 Tax=Cellvibrio sp. pealriver TaxID=1622269 RepID=UPI00066FF893|nr:flagellar protein FlaG [Cellvibrio sp. pealriver]
MNDITKVASNPVQAKASPVSSLPGARGQKTGNDLPPAAEAARSLPKDPVNSQAVQERVQAAVAQMNEYIQSTQRDLNFSYDPDSGETVVKVLDRATQEVIRQIPDEIFLRLAQSHTPDEPGQLFSAQA